METKNLKVKKLVIEIEGEPVKVTPVAPVKTVAPVKVAAVKATATKKEKETPTKERGMFWDAVLIVAVLLLVFVLGWLLFKAIRNWSAKTPTNPATAPVSVLVGNNEGTWSAVLTSANSNGNFIADLGGHGNGAVIPETATDLQGKTWEISRVLLTYCEDASTCFYSYGKPGDKLSRAFNVNAYTPEFLGDLSNELQYVSTGWNNNSDVTWTFIP